MTDAPQTARDDTAAIAAYAGRYGLPAEAAAADWRFLVEGDREHFRGVAAGAPDETLTEHVPVRFPAGTIAAAKHLAAAEGVTVSAWIRREVEREVGRREKQPAPELDAGRVFAEWWEAMGYDEDRRFGRFEMAYAFGAGAQAWSMVELDRQPQTAPGPLSLEAVIEAEGPDAPIGRLLRHVAGTDECAQQPAPELAADISTRALAYAEDREADEIAAEDDGVSVDIGSPEDGDYKAYADGLFAPVKDEVARLRAQMDAQTAEEETGDA